MNRFTCRIAALLLLVLTLIASATALAYNDPFAPGDDAFMPAGPYKGWLQDTTSNRSTRQLTDDEARAFGGPTEGYAYVANVFHFGHFYVARVPLGELSSVIVQVEHFKPELIAAHTLLRFHFAGSVDLLPQDAEASPARTQDLEFSSDYSAPPGVKFDLVHGLYKYALVNRMTSFEQKIDEMLVQHHHRVNQIRLTLSAQERQRMLLNALAIAGKEGLHTMYHTIKHSCVTQMFRVIDLAVDPVHLWRDASFAKKLWLVLSYVPKKVALYVTTHMPVMARGALCERFLLGPDSRLPDLNVELAQ